MSDVIRSFFASPLPFAVALAVLGFFLLHKHTRITLILWALAGLMVLQSSAWMFEWFAEPLIERAQQLSINSGCLDTDPVLVVLGGGIASTTRLSDSSRERVEKAAEFLSAKPKIVILTGGPTLGDHVTTEAALGERDLRQLLGARAADLTIYREEHSLSTHQNATGTWALMQEHNLGRQIILVTGVFHMRRAAATFQKQGFEICALPSYPPSLKPPQALSYGNTLWIAGLLHEYFGYWYYQWRGWVD